MRKRLFILAGISLAAGLLLYAASRSPSHYTRTRVQIEIPPVTLLSQSGAPTDLRSLLLGDKGVMLEFSYTSCTTFCADQAVKFANLQQKIKPGSVHLVSVTIDPQVDTPGVLASYLRKYRATPGWDYLTGSLKDILEVMEAFDISPTNMLTFDSSLLLHRQGDADWVRIDGRLGGEDLLREYQWLTGDRP